MCTNKDLFEYKLCIRCGIQLINEYFFPSKTLKHPLLLSVFGLTQMYLHDKNEPFPLSEILVGNEISKNGKLIILFYYQFIT